MEMHVIAGDNACDTTGSDVIKWQLTSKKSKSLPHEYAHV